MYRAYRSNGEPIVQMSMRIPKDLALALRHYSIDVGIPMSDLVTRALGEKLGEWGIVLDGFTTAMDYRPPPR